MKHNFEVIQSKIKLHKDLNEELRKAKFELNKNQDEIKEKRKNYSYFDKKVFNEEISALNQKRDELKQSISNLKKQIKIAFSEAEKMIFGGIQENYSEIYERQLSRLYGKHVEVIVKKTGDDFSEDTCYAEGMVVTHDKIQHGKILKMSAFGLRDADNNYMERKAHVEFCVYTKAFKAGEVIPYDPEKVAKRKIVKIKYKEGEELC